MKILLSLNPSLPIEAALLLAARSALTTAILAHNKTFDMSRLTLLSFHFDCRSFPKGNDLVAETEIRESRSTEAGQHYVISVNFGEASIEFEIVDRKRGLKKGILHHLHNPERRFSEETPGKEISFEGNGEETWPLEQLLIAALTHKNTNKFSFFLYAPAKTARPIVVLAGATLTEIVQENVLIAQLI